MKKIVLILLISGLFHYSGLRAQSIFVSKVGEVSLFSATKMENIDAKNKQANSVLNTATGDIVFSMPMRGFKFKQDLMEEHFNEKYVESDKFPEATFKGKINEKIDYTKDGTYAVTATGKMKIHGVENERTEKGTITIKDGVISLQCAFNVILKDYNVEVPKLVMENIAEGIAINMNFTYEPYKK